MQILMLFNVIIVPTRARATGISVQPPNHILLWLVFWDQQKLYIYHQKIHLKLIQSKIIYLRNYQVMIFF